MDALVSRTTKTLKGVVENGAFEGLDREPFLDSGI